MISRPTFFLSIVFLLLSAIQSAQADIFYYEDAQGTLRFSDEPPVQPVHYSVRSDDFAERFRSAVRHYSKAELRRLIARFSGRYNINAALVEAIVKAESEYNAMAVSRKGAKGLMQLMPKTAASLGVSDLHDPLENLKGGIRHLRRLLQRYRGNIDLAVAAYNAGERAVTRHKGVPPYRETVDYVAKVRKYYTRFASLTPPT